MRVAILASRKLVLPHLNELLPEDATELIASDAGSAVRDIEACARERGISLRAIPLERGKYGREARLAQGRQIIANAGLVLAFWDGKSRDIPRLLRHCSCPGVPFCVVRADKTAKPR